MAGEFIIIAEGWRESKYVREIWMTSDQEEGYNRKI